MSTTTTALESSAPTTCSRGSSRRQVWVLPGLQMRFVAWIVGTSAIVATTVAWAVLLAVWSPLADSMVWSRAGMQPDRLFLDACLRVLGTTLLMIVIFGLVAFLVGVIVSHRVAGPLYRIAFVARRVARGSLGERVELRHDDYIHDFTRSFNEMLDGLEARFQRQRRLLAALHQQLTEAEAAATRDRLTQAQFEDVLEQSLRLVREARIEELAEETPVE